jgi:hypothetical protein
MAGSRSTPSKRDFWFSFFGARPSRKLKRRVNKIALPKSRRRWLAWILAALSLVGLLVVGVWLVGRVHSPEPAEAPEAQKVLDIQAGMPFQILIPAYLPQDYDRANVHIIVDQTGPNGEPMVELTYPNRQGKPLFIREWVPVDPNLEIMATSKPIQTKWGQGWFLNQAGGLLVIWVDVGPLRIAILNTNIEILPEEKMLAVAETLGPASNRVVFSFIVNPPNIQQVAPPPPMEIETNAQGVQEVTLVVTPGGYSPLRFAVKKGVPVRLIFRMLGEVGCGNELNFPIGKGSMASLTLDSSDDQEVLEFTPQETGEFEFFCAHLMYRGVLTVHD